MLSKQKGVILKNICHSEVYKRIPINEVNNLRINYFKLEKIFLSVVSITIDGQDFWGKARCSEKDNFCKKTGRELAFKRAIRKYWNSKK